MIEDPAAQVTDTISNLQDIIDLIVTVRRNLDALLLRPPVGGWSLMLLQAIHSHGDCVGNIPLGTLHVGLLGEHRNLISRRNVIG